MFLSFAPRKHNLRHVGKSLIAMSSLILLLAAPAAIAAEYTGAVIGKPRIIHSRHEDTLSNIAVREEVGYAELLAANPGVDPIMPGEGTKIVLPTQKLLPNAKHEGLIINAGELRLYYFPPDGSEPKTFPIGMGREGLSTPMGTTTVVRKAANPPWRPTPRMLLENPELESVVKGGDPENPLGKYALYMGWPSYLIHGTSKAQGVGRRASSGCLRMYAPHIEWLYKNVPNGTKIQSVNQSVKMARIDGEIFIEATPNDIQVDEIEYHSRQKTVQIDDGTIKRILDFAGDDSSRIDWHKTRKILVTRNGLPTQITKGKEISLGKPVVTKPKEKAADKPKDAPQKADKAPVVITEKYDAPKSAPTAVKKTDPREALKQRNTNSKTDFNHLN
jgi:L,D-transpeptidase ErfK/SrfK